MIDNPWRARPAQSCWIRFGEPSWIAALRFRIYRLLHRDYYATYERRYDAR